MAQLNFKVTTWERVHIPDEFVDIVKQGIEDGTITSSLDLFDIPELEGVDFDFDLSDEGPDQLSIEDNNGDFTIELRTDEEYDLITTNLNSIK